MTKDGVEVACSSDPYCDAQPFIDCCPQGPDAWRRRFRFHQISQGSTKEQTKKQQAAGKDKDGHIRLGSHSGATTSSSTSRVVRFARIPNPSPEGINVEP